MKAPLHWGNLYSGKGRKPDFCTEISTSESSYENNAEIFG